MDPNFGSWPVGPIRSAVIINTDWCVGEYMMTLAIMLTGPPLMKKFTFPCSSSGVTLIICNSAESAHTWLSCKEKNIVTRIKKITTEVKYFWFVQVFALDECRCPFSG
jgi:hypothetical protein